jgi:hypothetical protein
MLHCVFQPCQQIVRCNIKMHKIGRCNLLLWSVSVSESRMSLSHWQLSSELKKSLSKMFTVAGYIGWRNRFLGIDSWAP